MEFGKHPNFSLNCITSNFISREPAGYRSKEPG